MAGTCECSNEPSVSIRCGEFLDKSVSFSRRTLLHAVSNKEVTQCNEVLDNPVSVLAPKKFLACTQTEVTSLCCSQQSATALCSEALESSPVIHIQFYEVLFNTLRTGDADLRF